MESEKPAYAHLADRLEQFLQKPDELQKRNDVLQEIFEECAKSQELPGILWSYFDSLSQGLLLFKNLVQQELQKTIKIGDVLSESNITSRLFFWIFFTDLGKKFIVGTLTPMFQEILRRKTIGDAFLAEVTEQFLTQALTNVELCPIMIRESLFTFSDCLSSKFEDADVSYFLSILYFQRLFGYAIYNAVTFFTELEGIKHIRIEDLEFINQFIAISLGLPSLTTTDRVSEDLKYEKKLKFQQKAQNFFKELVNVENISKVKRLIAASVEQTVGDVSKKEAKHNLVKSMRKSAISLNSFAKQIDIQAQRNAAIAEMSSSKEWKQVRSSKRGKAVVYSRNDSEMSAFKCEVLIKGDPMKAVTVWEKEELMQIFDPRTKKLFFVESLPNIGSTEVSIWYMEIQLPFPFSNRDLLFKRYKDISEDLLVSWSQSIERSDFPVKKNTVRMNVKSAGLMFQIDPKNPGCFKFTYYFNTPQQAYLPTWMVNAAASDYLEALKRYKKYVESNYPPSK